MAYDEGRARTLLFGGRDGATLFGDTWEWDGEAWARFTPAASPSPRSGHTLAYDPLRGVTVLFGGEGATGALQDTWEWDGRVWVPVTTPTTPTQRSEHCMAAYVDATTNTSYILMHGGLVNGGYQTGTWKYDGSNWTYFNSGPMPSARKNAAMARDTYFGTTMMLGGYFGGTTLADAWYWTGQGWLQLANGPAIHSHAMVFENSSGGFVTRGGLDVTTPLQVAYNGAVASVGNVVWNSYSTQTTWGHVPSLAWLAASAFDTRRQRTVAFGGMTTTGPIGELAERPVGGLWQVRLPPSPVGPPRRIYSAMVWDTAHDHAVVFGGLDPWSTTPATFADTWFFDGRSWTQPTFGLFHFPPAARRGHAMVYVEAGPHWPGELWMEGGYDDVTATRLGDFYRLQTNGTYGWGWLGPSNSTPRADHAMVYDRAAQRVISFGGYGNSGPLADTAEWRNPLLWYRQTITTNGSPGARYSHAMAYDARRQRTVLFGGADAVGAFRGDTWEYDSTTSTWTQVATTGPSPRVNCEMGFDAARGVVVMTGGRTAAGALRNDVWEWNGVAWTQRALPTTQPPPREGAAMTWDPTQRRFLLFGGVPNDPSVWSYTADGDRFADGMQGGSSALRCMQFPVAGRETGFTFASSHGFGWFALGFGAAPVPALFFDPPIACGSRGFVFPVQPIVVPVGGSPARITFTLPGNMAGIGLTLQGLSLDLGQSCVRFTDPLAMTIAAP
ncbi:MAG: hypothetical protein IPK26_20610 [Planctomycetes bacterium]|nr:hypothetical protein [Planctomycetota bacterium]